MVEKIYVRPEEVRGLGNIIIPKSLEDYETYKSVLAEGSDEVYGTVYTMDYLGVDGIVLSSDKSILSYADSDVASISAQLTYGGEPVAVSGEIVEFEVRKVSDDSLVRTLRPGRTDGTGTAVTSMVSSGSGDVYVKASYRSLVSKTYEICDAWKYIQNPTACTNCNIEVPSKASIEYTMKHIGSDGISIQLQDATHTYFIGNWSSLLMNGVLIRNTGSSSNLVSQTVADIPSDIEVLIKVEYNNGQWKYTANNNTAIFSANYTPLKISTVENNRGSSYMRDLIIKPL